MRSPPLVAVCVLACCLGVNSAARADFDVEGTFLIGSGVDTGDHSHNPYALQVGGEVELIISGFVGGFRALRAMSSGEVERDADLRALAGDIGFDWELWILHLGPRIALGKITTVKREDFSSFFLEPGVVAEFELGWFVIGADVRYRVVTEDMDRNGFLAYARMGLRF